MILHLGVIELPYVDAPTPGRKRSRKRRASTVTTGDVAGWLENRYGVMQAFATVHEKDVAADLEKSVVGALESFMLGAPAQLDPFGSATSSIEDRFKQFLSTREVETVGIPGVPTQAALMGINRRLKSGRGPRRPSFIDTSLYQSSFKAWVER
jgi:hypothetical protein